MALIGVVLAGREGLASGALTLPQVFSALTLAGLLGAPLALIERAIEYRHGHRIAAEKINRLLALPAAEALAASRRQAEPPVTDSTLHPGAAAPAAISPATLIPTTGAFHA